MGLIEKESKNSKQLEPGINTFIPEVQVFSNII